MWSPQAPYLVPKHFSNWSSKIHTYYTIFNQLPASLIAWSNTLCLSESRESASNKFRKTPRIGYRGELRLCVLFRAETPAQCIVYSILESNISAYCSQLRVITLPVAYSRELTARLFLIKLPISLTAEICDSEYPLVYRSLCCSWMCLVYKSLCCSCTRLV
jgi:hypothetical protein